MAGVGRIHDRKRTDSTVLASIVKESNRHLHTVCRKSERTKFNNKTRRRRQKRTHASKRGRTHCRSDMRHSKSNNIINKQQTTSNVKNINKKKKERTKNKNDYKSRRIRFLPFVRGAKSGAGAEPMTSRPLWFSPGDDPTEPQHRTKKKEGENRVLFKIRCRIKKRGVTVAGIPVRIAAKALSIEAS